jgi:hypothetical protein
MADNASTVVAFRSNRVPNQRIPLPLFRVVVVVVVEAMVAVLLLFFEGCLFFTMGNRENGGQVERCNRAIAPLPGQYSVP